MANTRRRNRVGWGGDTTVSAATADSLDLLSYDPNPVPEDDKDLRRYINDELFKIRDTFYEILDNMSSTSDYYLDVAKGLIPGHTSVNKFGRNYDVATNSGEVIWTAGGSGAAYNLIPTGTAPITHIWANVDDASLRGLDVIIQGVDDDYNIANFTATLDATNATTAVALNTFTDGVNLKRCFRMQTVAWANGEPNQDIYVGNSGKTAFNGMIRGYANQTLQAAYTVPAGKTAYITKYYGSINKDSGGGTPAGQLTMFAQKESEYYYRVKHVMGLDLEANSKIEHDMQPYYKVTEKTDIFLSFTNTSGSATADISAGFELILVDDGY